MCWEKGSDGEFYKSVSVAGCLGYDVLGSKEGTISKVKVFQLLVV